MDESPLSKKLEKCLNQFNPDLPLQEAFTPPASWYTQADFLKLEGDRVFNSSWLFAGRADQAANPGDYFTGTILNRPYVVTRNEEHELQAFYNVCSHHGTCVARGAGKTEQLVCPYHGWTYSLSGKLNKAPKAGDIKQRMAMGLNLKPICVQNWGPFIFIRFAREGVSLEDQLKGFHEQFPMKMLENLDFVHRQSYEIPCNWKVFVDNYLDGGYHVPFMHKGLSAQLNLNSYRTEMGEWWSLQSCGSSSDEGTDHEDDFRERLGDRALYAWIYPHFMINRYGKWMDVNIVLPINENRCLTLFDYYYDGEIQEEELSRALKASDRVQQEDMDICNMVQTGLNSGAYNKGIYAPRFEAPMYHFHRLLLKSLRS